jgi:hypothetical protein
VVLFVVVKFTEGAWLNVIIFPVLVYTLIRLNRQYGKEAAILEDAADDLHPHPPNYSRRVVLLLVDSYDLATIAAIRYAKSLHPSALRAVHFSLDSAQASKLRQRWLAAGLSIPLELADCPDRRLGHAAAELAAAEAAAPGTHVTVVLPRRSYPPLAGRLLHDHTADRPVKHDSNVLACEVADSTGELTAMFYGCTDIAGLEPGRRIRLPAWSASAPTAAPP